MIIDMNSATDRIKKAGPTNCRILPMEGHNINGGLYKIEVKDNGTWVPVAVNIDKVVAENVVSQATNRVICG